MSYLANAELRCNGLANVRGIANAKLFTTTSFLCFAIIEILYKTN